MCVWVCLCVLRGFVIVTNKHILYGIMFIYPISLFDINTIGVQTNIYIIWNNVYYPISLFDINTIGVQTNIYIIWNNVYFTEP